jgi:hypothetical protein
MCALIQYYAEDVHVEIKVRSIIMAWRKYTYLRKNRDNFKSHFEQNRNLKIKQTYLSHWYSALMRSLPARLIFEKTAETYKRHHLRSALVKIATVAI